MPVEVRKEIIMVVDPKPEERQTIQRNLEVMGFPVVAAENGQEAMDMLDVFTSSDIKLVITDQDLPPREGMQLLKGLQRKNSEAKVVYMSGGRSSKTPGEMQRLGIVAHLQKPVERENLSNLVDTLLRPY
jgi:DNA-binding NtrC family response regulator